MTAKVLREMFRSMSSKVDYISRYKPEMDGLRACACIIVLAGHSVMLNSGDYQVYAAGIAKIGVWLFFALSAFLLTLKIAHSPFNWRYLSAFYIGRFIRIVPMFVVAVIFYYLTQTIGPWTAENLVQALFFQGDMGHLWTIPPELGFYLILPLITAVADLLYKFKGPRCAILFVGILISIAVIMFPPIGSIEHSRMPFPFATSFGAGVMAAYMAMAYGARFTTWWTIPLALVGVLLTVFVSKIGIFGLHPKSLMDKHYILGPLWAVISFAVYLRRDIISIWLSARWLVWIGEASFSIYLFHWSFGVWFSEFPLAFSSPMMIATSIFVGRLSYRFIELPTYNLRKFVD